MENLSWDIGLRGSTLLFSGDQHFSILWDKNLKSNLRPSLGQDILNNMFIFFLIIIAELQELPPVCVASLLDVDTVLDLILILLRRVLRSVVVTDPGNSTVVKTPGWPRGYSNNLRCEWVVSSQPGSRVQLRIISLSLESSYRGCLYDKVIN